MLEKSCAPKKLPRSTGLKHFKIVTDLQNKIQLLQRSQDDLSHMHDEELKQLVEGKRRSDHEHEKLKADYGLLVDAKMELERQVQVSHKNMADLKEKHDKELEKLNGLIQTTLQTRNSQLMPHL